MAPICEMKESVRQLNGCTEYDWHYFHNYDITYKDRYPELFNFLNINQSVLKLLTSMATPTLIRKQCRVINSTRFACLTLICKTVFLTILH